MLFSHSLSPLFGALSVSVLTFALGMPGVLATISSEDWDTSSELPQTAFSATLISPEEGRAIGQALIHPDTLSLPPQREAPPIRKVPVPASLRTFFGATDDSQEIDIAIPEEQAFDLTSLSLAPSERASRVLQDTNQAQTRPSSGAFSSFESNLKHPSLQENTLKSLGIEVTDDTLASYFLEPLELFRRLVGNFHGPELKHDKGDFTAERSLPIFEGLRQTKSVKTLSLKSALLTSQSYLALATTLAYNRSLKRLDLTDAAFAEDALFILGYGLQKQSFLKEIILRPKFTILPEHLERFYQLIAPNTGLRLITWPQDDKLLKKLRALSETKNAPAVLHRGVMYAEGIYETQDFKKALVYLKKAYDLNHPLAAYEIARLYKRQNNVTDAFAWYKNAAHQGYPKALAKLGDYHRGIWPKGSMKEADYKEAYQYYSQAARQGNAKGLYRLGRMYEGGRFVEKDLNKAADLFYQATERGYPDAFTALGALYHNPDYSSYDPKTGQYYLTWGTRFSKSKGTAERLLASTSKTPNTN